MTDKEESDKLFVAKWLEAVRQSRQLDWVAAELHSSKAYVKNRATNLRRHGVELPSLLSGKRGISRGHIEELNNIIKGDE